MSGGHFDYNQYHIGEIADKIESIIEKNGVEFTEEEKRENAYWYGNPNYFQENPGDAFYTSYSEEVLNKFKEAVKYLRIAQVYAQRIDWYLSGDDGEESFFERLEEDLKNLKHEN